MTYDATRWLDKNRDSLPPGVTEMLQSSSNALVKLIFRGKGTVLVNVDFDKIALSFVQY